MNLAQRYLQAYKDGECNAKDALQSLWFFALNINVAKRPELKPVLISACDAFNEILALEKNH